MARNGKVIISKGINLEKEHRNILNYSSSTMLELMQGQTHLVSYLSDYSFVGEHGKGGNVIDVSASYDNLIVANYIAYQNPTYSNKWFFAFIDKIEFINPGTTRITFTVDEWATWYDNLTFKSCFVVREHVNSDLVGEHTIPEDLETGEYICNSHTKDATMDSYSSDLCFIMASTSEPITGEAKDTVSHSSIYNGIYTGLTYYRYDVTSAIDIILELFANNGKTDAINGIFMAPKWLSTLASSGTPGLYREVEQSNTPQSFNITLAKQTTLNGYTPKNNKCLVFPYNYLIVSNNIGQNAILHYEKFSGSNATFIVRGVLNPGCSINMTPTSYNGSDYSDNDAIQLGKFPICNFQNDMYTNWLTQNSINVLGQTITSDDLNIISSAIDVLKSPSFGSVNSIANSVMQKKQHNMISPTVNGQLNSADVNVASGNNTFHFYKMSVKAEFGRVIDAYFTRFGYKVNSLKVPNITGRTYWNYVEIGAGEDVAFGDVPINAMESINNIFRSGTTIFHSHDNIGNFSLNNTIVS